MSIAAAHYEKFKEQIVKEGMVFTFLDEGHYLIFKVGGNEVMPFWSSKERLQKIQESNVKYQKYETEAIEFQRFYNWLPKIEKDNIHIGVNWSGDRLVGYDVDVDSLVKGLDYWVNQFKKNS